MNTGSQMVREQVLLTKQFRHNCENQQFDTILGLVWLSDAGAGGRRIPLRRYLFGLRLAIAQADARSAMPVSFR